MKGGENEVVFYKLNFLLSRVIVLWFELIFDIYLIKVVYELIF